MNIIIDHRTQWKCVLKHVSVRVWEGKRLRTGSAAEALPPEPSPSNGEAWTPVLSRPTDPSSKRASSAWKHCGENSSARPVNALIGLSAAAARWCHRGSASVPLMKPFMYVHGCCRTRGRVGLFRPRVQARVNTPTSSRTNVTNGRKCKAQSPDGRYGNRLKCGQAEISTNEQFHLLELIKGPPDDAA